MGLKAPRSLRKSQDGDIFSTLFGRSLQTRSTTVVCGESISGFIRRQHWYIGCPLPQTFPGLAGHAYHNGPMLLAEKTRFGPYEIISPLGAGGMGEAYEARDTRLERTVAIKICKGQLTERFEREARAISEPESPAYLRAL